MSRGSLEDAIFRDVFMLPELKLMWEIVSLEVYTENDNLEIIVYPTKLSEAGDDSWSQQWDSQNAQNEKLGNEMSTGCLGTLAGHPCSEIF